MEKSSVNENKEIVRTFFDQFEKGNRNEVEKLWGDNYILHYPGQSQPLTKAESKEIMREFNEAFPDLKFTFQLQIAEGECVVTRMVGRGTHKGEFNGIPATNKKVTASGIAIHRIINKKIVEEYVEFDALGLIQQLGVPAESLQSNSNY